MPELKEEVKEEVKEVKEEVKEVKTEETANNMLLEVLDTQKAEIAKMKETIEELKKMNMHLALHNSVGEKKESTEELINKMF